MPRTTGTFWDTLPRMGRDERPFVCCAPMADVTDTAFREMIAKYSRMGEPGGGPDVLWTEFVSVHGLMSEGRENMLRDFEYTEDERPIVAQIFGSDPEIFEQAAALVVELGFDGIDINMGCPDRAVCKQGAGSALIKDPTRAQEIIRAAKRGARGLPISVKTRMGWHHDETEEWVSALAEAEPALITLHVRTKKELSKVPPRYEAITRARKVLDERFGNDRPLLAVNGGIVTLQDACTVSRDFGCDGVMIGKGIFGSPWFFDWDRNNEAPPLTERLEIMLEHTRRFTELLSDQGPETEKATFRFGSQERPIANFQRGKNFAIMKKHYKAYVNGFEGAKELRMQLMDADTYEQIETLTRNFMKTL